MVHRDEVNHSNSKGKTVCVVGLSLSPVARSVRLTLKWKGANLKEALEISNAQDTHSRGDRAHQSRLWV